MTFTLDDVLAATLFALAYALPTLHRREISKSGDLLHVIAGANRLRARHDDMTVRIRAVDRERDRVAVSAIDTAFETKTILDVVVRARGIELVERALSAPRSKRYPMADAFAAWSTWNVGWVAEDGPAVCGFAAVEYEAWHGRLVLWHLYVTQTRRREGIASALLAHVEQHGRTVGAERVWLETTSINVPGIAAYDRLGYALCGVDVTVYDRLPYADEAAVYLAKRLTA
jgi:ribosomal protein S18 acetylase RimI-like enzyme